MRVARRGSNGTWHLVECEGQVQRIVPLTWDVDHYGHWPLVEWRVREIGTDLVCPCCGTAWPFEEMDCIFGDARREGNDITVLVQCLRCRLPHRVRLAGGFAAYPQLVERMAGWTDWAHREQRVRELEVRLYGVTLSAETGSEACG